LAGKPARQTTFLFWRKTKTGSALLQNLFSYICFDRIVLFLPRIKAKPAPQGIAQEQCSYQPKKITDADTGKTCGREYSTGLDCRRQARQYKAAGLVPSDSCQQIR
jgi:hypothetical protein